MIDYSNWELRSLSVDAVRLDKHNPRLPEDMLSESQENIMHYMVNEFDILEIAKSVARNGFFINEYPIVVKEGRFFVVVEGNRRITALKLLRNPDLAPPRKKYSYVRLSEGIDVSQWNKIKMYIAPSKAEASPILIARHGSEMIAPWQRIMKMRFLAGDVLRGVSYEAIAGKYAVSVSEVKIAAITMIIREMIRETDLSDEKKDLYLSEKFQTSTLARIIETKKFGELFGLNLVGSTLHFGVPQEAFVSVILKICGDIESGDVTHRSHDGVDVRNNYIECLYKSVASGERGGGEYVAHPREEPEEKGEVRKPKSRKKWERLIPDSVQYNTGNKKLNDLIVEGQNMSVASSPHAAGLLLRTILDLAVQRLYDIHGKLLETKNEDGRTLGLTKRINNLLSRHAEWLADKSTCDKLKQFTAKDSSSFVHIETLNDYAHGDYGRPTKDDLRNFWARISPLLDMILQEGD